MWVRADSQDLLVSDFLLAAELLHLPERNEQDQRVVINAVKRWFNTHERWLLILDNADQVEDVSGFLPSADRGHILLTTRAHATGTVAQRIVVEQMMREEGMLLLLRRAKLVRGNAGLQRVTGAMRAQAQSIVDEVDGFPLALDQAGAYIEETGCSLSDYLLFYQIGRERLLRLRGREATGHPESVVATWSLSFEKVEERSPVAAALLRVCALLHPDAIPETMIEEGATFHKNRSVSYAASALCGGRSSVAACAGDLRVYTGIQSSGSHRVHELSALALPGRRQVRGG